jgi:hypothetical protein
MRNYTRVSSRNWAGANAAGQRSLVEEMHEVTPEDLSPKPRFTFRQYRWRT